MENQFNDLTLEQLEQVRNAINLEIDKAIKEKEEPETFITQISNKICEEGDKVIDRLSNNVGKFLGID